uniref:HAT C-terminal dimerisation domain-containing protein n=1 Tax=Globisporangium ultimum (strain ATCC 200006 / CBS 805.95 / DAOM BR144) TaxID=431595 RepID=K3WJB3_GLOUD
MDALLFDAPDGAAETAKSKAPPAVASRANGSSQDPTPRARGHRAQSQVWKFLTHAENPHKETVSTCMHCAQNVPHHRKSEKARAHLNRCTAFRARWHDLPLDARPQWVDFEGKKRKAGVALLAAEERHVKDMLIVQAGAAQVSTEAHMSSAAVVSGNNTSMPNGAEVHSGAPRIPLSTLPTSNTPAATASVKRRPTTRSVNQKPRPAIPASTGVDADVTSRMIHEALAMHFYTTATPLERIDDLYLQAAFRCSNPDVVLPSVTDLAGHLLENAYTKVKSRVWTLLSSSEFNCLTMTGWRHLDRRIEEDKEAETGQRVEYLVANEQHTFVLETSVLGLEQRLDADFLAHKIMRLMSDCDHKISGVVTDNTPAHQRMWNRLKSAFPGRFFYGCASHGLDLFVQDIFCPVRNDDGNESRGKYPDGYPFEPLAQLTETCEKIATVLYQDEQLHLELSQLLRETGATAEMVHQFPSSRHAAWRRLKAAFQSVHAAYNVLRGIVIRQEFISRSSLSQYDTRAHVQQQLLRPDFVLLLEKAIAILHPLDRFMSLFETASKPCSEVFYVFAKALPDELLAIPGLTKIEQTYLLIRNQTRFNGMYGDVHGIAYVLDPQYIGDGLNSDVRKSIEDIIFDLPINSDQGIRKEGEDAVALSNRHNAVKLDLAQQFTEYVIDATREKNNHTFRYTLLVKQKKTALQYWLTDGQRWPLLQKIACKVFSLPASTNSLERKVPLEKATLPATIRGALPADAIAKLAYIRANHSAIGEGDTSAQEQQREDGVEGLHQPYAIDL